MFEFYLGEKRHEMKNSWYELSQDEFVKVCSVINRFRKAEINLFEARVLLTMLLIGLDIKRVRTGGHMDENIYKLSRELNFFFRIKYEDQKAFKAFSPEKQQLLIKNFPEDLEQDPEVRVAVRLKKHIELNIEFGSNIIRTVRQGRNKLNAYTFEVTDGIAQTSLTALQYSEAQKVISLYSQNQSDQLLNLLCGILFQNGYKEETAVELSKQYKGIDHEIKDAVLMNFLAITNFIVHQTKYSILFDRPKRSGKGSNKYSLGLADNLYMLSKKGYGDSKQMEDAGLFKFLDMLIKEMADQVHELKAAKKKISEIATIMNLTIEQVNDLI